MVYKDHKTTSKFKKPSRIKIQQMNLLIIKPYNSYKSKLPITLILQKMNKMILIRKGIFNISSTQFLYANNRVASILCKF